MQDIQSLRPDGFTLTQLDEELFCMTMIRSLPEDYNNLVTSLLLKGSLDKDTIIQAFQTEENQRQHRATSESLISPTAKVVAAGNASLVSSSTSQNTHQNDWNADTGASSHMSPHREWFLNYRSHCVPIRLADHTLIYSAGIGDVEFRPTFKGQEKRPVIFTSVLHVPLLQNNLLAVLCLDQTERLSCLD
jgi:hypothetical protein